MPASLDPVQAFKDYPSHPSQTSASNEQQPLNLWTACPKACARLERRCGVLLDESILHMSQGRSAYGFAEKAFLTFMMKFPFPVRLRHWFIISRWQKWLFPCCLLHSLSGHPYLAVDAWPVLGGSGSFGAFADGCRARWSHALVGPPGVQNAVAWS